MQDFEAALDEVQPAFGANAESLQKNVMQVGWGWLTTLGCSSYYQQAAGCWRLPRSSSSPWWQRCKHRSVPRFKTSNTKTPVGA
jgi:hypothetical protein